MRTQRIDEGRLKSQAILEFRRRSQPSVPPFTRYAGRPWDFLTEKLGVILTADQLIMLKEIERSRTVNIQAAHGVGKTFLLAGYVVYWVAAVGGLGITTAPTSRQVKELLWSEIRRHVARLRGLGETIPKADLLQWRISEDWRAYGFSAMNTNSDGFQGVHHHRLLAIQDEANGISKTIDEGFVSCVTGSENKGIRIGNPTEPGTAFFEHCERSNIKIPVWTHPNVSWAYDLHADKIHRLKPEVAKAILDKDGVVKPIEEWPAKYAKMEVVPGAVTVQWIEDRRIEHGEFSNYWTGRIDAEFPEDSEDALVPRSWFRAAVQRYKENPEFWDAQASGHDWHHGLDVGDGGDPHALAGRRGPVLYTCKIFHTKGDRLDVSRAADLGRDTYEELGGKLFVDIIGVGAGANSQLIRDRVPSVGVNVGNKPKDPKTSVKKPNEKKFRNLRAQVYWGVREMFRLETIAIAIEDKRDQAVIEQELSGIHYSETITGKIQIEPKDDIRERLGRSTDRGDAIALAFYEASTMAGGIARAMKQAGDTSNPVERKARKKLR